MQIFIPKCNRKRRSDKVYVRSQSYSEYLSGGHWKQVKSKARRIYGFKCIVCQSNDGLNHHHLFYPEERVDTKSHHVLPLCQKCHQSYHDSAPNGGINESDINSLKMAALITDVFKYALRAMPYISSAQLPIFRNRFITTMELFWNYQLPNSNNSVRDRRLMERRWNDIQKTLHYRVESTASEPFPPAMGQSCKAVGLVVASRPEQG